MCRRGHAKSVFLTPDPEPPGEVVGVQGLRPVTRRGQNDGLRQVVIVGVARVRFDVAHAIGPTEAISSRGQPSRNAEQVADREADHEAATTVLKFHWYTLPYALGYWFTQLKRSRGLAVPSEEVENS